MHQKDAWNCQREVYRVLPKFSDLSGTEIEKLEEHLTSQPVAATDATTVSLNGKQSYIRNISDEKTVVYYGMEKKTKEALGEIPFFQQLCRHCCYMIMKRHYTPVWDRSCRMQCTYPEISEKEYRRNRKPVVKRAVRPVM